MIELTAQLANFDLGASNLPSLPVASSDMLSNISFGPGVKAAAIGADGGLTGMALDTGPLSEAFAELANFGVQLLPAAFTIAATIFIIRKTFELSFGK